MAILKDFRLKITAGYPDQKKNVTYLTRTKGVVSFFNGSEVPLSLSNLLNEHAAEGRFALTDCLAGNAAAVIRKFWERSHPHARPEYLKVEQV